MKIFKRAALIALMVSGFAVTVHADTAIISGEVAPITNYSFTPLTLALPNDMTTLGNTDIGLGDLLINNNNVGGYKVTIASAQSGKLVRYSTVSSTYYSVTAGNATDYTIKFVAHSSAPGVSGMVAPAGFLSTNTSLGSPAIFDFSAPTKATVAAKYSMTLLAAANTALLDSNDSNVQYRDVITIIVADLN